MENEIAKLKNCSVVENLLDQPYFLQVLQKIKKRGVRLTSLSLWQDAPDSIECIICYKTEGRKYDLMVTEFTDQDTQPAIESTFFCLFERIADRYFFENGEHVCFEEPMNSIRIYYRSLS